jgi:hypothetical protein
MGSRHPHRKPLIAPDARLTMTKQLAWAVCPRPDDTHGTMTPRLFETDRQAQRFLNSKIRPPSPKAVAKESGLTVEEVLKRRAALEAERQEILNKIKSGHLHPTAMPHHLADRRHKNLGWCHPVLICHPEQTIPCAAFRRFSEFLTVADFAPRPGDLHGMLHRVFSGTMPDHTCLLAEDWSFGEIEKDASKRPGHEFGARRHESIGEMLLKSLYDLESSLFLFHKRLSCAAIANFWTSWNVQRHLAVFAERVSNSQVAQALSRSPDHDSRAARDALNIELSGYAHEIRPVSSHTLQTVEPDLQELISLLTTVDGQDAILTEDMRRNPTYKVPREQWIAIKGTLDAVFAILPDLKIPFEFQSQPGALRTQIVAVRTKLQYKIDVLECARPSATLSGADPVQPPQPLAAESNKQKRAASTITSFAAAKKMQAYIDANGLGQTAFATIADTTDRTIRSFRATGKVRKDVFSGIAKAMGLTVAQLLEPEDPGKISGK